jgi:hypothetical protein
MLLLLVIGCDSQTAPVQTYPVAGTVTVDGEPLRTHKGTVRFQPNKEKGNSTLSEVAGSIDGNGNYQLWTAGKTGAPPGWYKVAVAAYEAPRNGKPAQMFKPAHSLLCVNRRYRDAATSGIEVEVVAKPPAGAYDLKVKK